MRLDFRIISMPQGYDKLLAPPPVGGQRKLEVKMSRLSPKYQLRKFRDSSLISNRPVL